MPKKAKPKKPDKILVEPKELPLKKRMELFKGEMIVIQQKYGIDFRVTHAINLEDASAPKK